MVVVMVMVMVIVAMDLRVIAEYRLYVCGISTRQSSRT
jgi:hypothetical protein